MRHSAVELFTCARKSYYFNFSSDRSCQEFLTVIAQISPGVEIIGRRKRGDYAVRQAQRQWQNREISNFDYIMILNRLAGRSYNDLN